MRYRNNSLVVGALLAVAVVLGGCGGGDNDSELAFDVDGTRVDSSELSSGVDAAGNTVILGSGDGWSIEIGFPGTEAGDFSSTSTTGLRVIYTDASGTGYEASDLVAASSTTITITSYDTKRIEGTFTTTVVAPNGDTHVITGSFTLVIPGVNFNNPYGGTYFGIFKVQGQVLEGTNPDPPYDPIWGPMQRSSFRITIELDHIASAEGSAVYYIVHANVTDTFFGCNVGGCTPDQGSVATLPDPPGSPTPGGPSQPGHGILIQFPNGSSLGTSNALGELYSSTDARSLSNVLGLDQTWVSLNAAGDSLSEVELGDLYNSLNPETRSMTWALTQSAF